MLINARSAEELRIAVVSDLGLENYQVEVGEGGLTRGNIYRGVIANLQPSLNAAFIDFGSGKNGFLAIQDVVDEARYGDPKPGKRAEIDDILQQGKPIVVQITREPENAKGAAITTNLSLAGRYLVFTPFDDTRGVSRKVEDEETRAELRSIAQKLELPEGGGVIVRTNALGETRAELQRDLGALLRVWKRIQTEARNGSGPRLLYSDQDLILRALRDHLDAGVEEILVDDETAYQQAAEYMQAFMPRTRVVLTHYVDRVPLFSKYSLESQIEQIFRRQVALPSGGSIVIDSTEALTAIDVNSGRGSNGGSHEEMALDVNLEAALEVGRQLRLRDLGGLVVVDFIDLRSTKGKRSLEKAMKDAMKIDKARSTVGRLSPNGLLEINRQRIQQSLRVRTQRPCPTCQGTGRVASLESIGLNLLRRIEGRAATGRLLKARVEMHPELAEAVQNGRRKEFARLEEEYQIEIEIVASHRLNGPEEQIEWRDRPSPIAVPPLRPAQIRERRSENRARTANAPIVFEPAEEGGDAAEEGESRSAQGNGADAGSGTGGEARRNGKKRRRGGKNRRGKRVENGGNPVLSSEVSILFAEGDEAEETLPLPFGGGPPELVSGRGSGEGDGSGGDRNGGGGARKRRRRGGRGRNGRRPEEGGGRTEVRAGGDRGHGSADGRGAAEGAPSSHAPDGTDSSERAPGNDFPAERNRPAADGGDSTRESVEARIARLAASFAPTI